MVTITATTRRALTIIAFHTRPGDTLVGSEGNLSKIVGVPYLLRFPTGDNMAIVPTEHGKLYMPVGDKVQVWREVDHAAGRVDQNVETAGRG